MGKEKDIALTKGQQHEKIINFIRLLSFFYTNKIEFSGILFWRAKMHKKLQNSTLHFKHI